MKLLFIYFIDLITGFCFILFLFKIFKFYLLFFFIYLFVVTKLNHELNILVTL